METRTVHDPFTGQDVQISDRLVDRLRGKYASGPHLPNGRPEFGWRQFEAPSIQHEAAERIEQLEAALRDCVVLAASQMGGLNAVNREDIAPHHKKIINRAQRLLGGRELP